MSVSGDDPGIQGMVNNITDAIWDALDKELVTERNADGAVVGVMSKADFVAKIRGDWVPVCVGIMKSLADYGGELNLRGTTTNVG
jgi:hypothetical protein